MAEAGAHQRTTWNNGRNAKAVLLFCGWPSRHIGAWSNHPCGFPPRVAYWRARECTHTHTHTHTHTLLLLLLLACIQDRQEDNLLGSLQCTNLHYCDTGCCSPMYRLTLVIKGFLSNFKFIELQLPQNIAFFLSWNYIIILYNFIAILYK